MTLFGTADMSLGISVILRDQFSAQSQRINQSMAQMDAQARRLQENQMRMQRNFNAAGAMVGVGAINQMRKWINTGAEFGYTMEYVNAISQKNGATFDQLNDKAKRLGETTMFSAVEVASAMRFMAMAGMDTGEIYNNISAAVNLAGSTMSELGGKGGAADIMTNVMRAFNLESNQSVRVADVLTLATSRANTNLFDLGEAMKYASATAKDLNVSMEEVAAMIMMAGDAGIQGSMAGTAIENMMRYITQAAGEASTGKRGKVLGSLGMAPEDLKDAYGNLKPFPELLGMIGNAVEGLGTADKQNALKELFGVRGKREASLLLRNMQQYGQYLQMLNVDSPGKSAQIMNSMMESMQGNIYKLTSAWDTFKITFTESLAPVIFPLLKGITAILQGLSAIMKTGFGKWLTIIGVGFVVMKTVSMGYRAIVATIRLLHTQLGTTMSAASAQSVAGYKAMTASANQYAMAASRANTAGSFGQYTRAGMLYRGPGGKFMNKADWMRGKYGPAGGFIGGTNWGGIANSGKGLIGRAGNWFRSNPFGASMGVGLAGMGLEMLGDKVGGTSGKFISGAGKTASGAGTGMMIGSVFGPLGTALGGLAGGIWGLVSAIRDGQDTTKDNTDATEKLTDAQIRMNTLNSSAMFTNSIGAEKAYQISRGNMSVLMDTYGVKPEALYNPFHSNTNPYRYYGSDVMKDDPFYRSDAGKSNTELNIYIDGEQKFQELIDESIKYNNIELGMY